MAIVALMRNLSPIQMQAQHPSLPNSIVQYIRTAATPPLFNCSCTCWISYVARVLHYLRCYYLEFKTQDEPSPSYHLLGRLLDYPIRIRLWGAIGSLPVLSDLQSMAGGIRPGVGHAVRLTVT